jgi:8-oxo-dGTP diphosphatase
LDGYYDFAASGHVEDGESIRDCAIRELEQIGVKSRIEDLKLVHINQNFLNIPYINFTCVRDTWIGKPKICEPEKCSDLGYFALDSLPKKCTLNARVNELTGFGGTLNYSFVTPEIYAVVMGDAGGV